LVSIYSNLIPESATQNSPYTTIKSVLTLGSTSVRGAKVYWLAIDAAAQHQLVHLGGQIKPRRCMRVHALAQCWARRYSGKTQRALEEAVVPKALDGCFKVAFAHAQQGQVAFEDFTVGQARAHGKLGIDQCVNVGAFEVFADKSQPSMGAEVIGQFFDNKVGHVSAHLRGEQHTAAKSMISIRKSTYLDFRVTDSGECLHV
jgi:hypothetical protein